ncbi:MAG: Rossmann-like and DUF2520 domain-containing protein [Actinomycetota bacterium]
MNTHPFLPERPRVALVATGRVGTAVAVLLRRAGCEIAGVWSRSAPSAKRAHELLDAPLLDLTVPCEADLILVGASDPAIPDVASLLVPTVTDGTVVAHLSGSLGTAALQPVAERGALALALHPVQACPDVKTAIERLPGSAWGITTASELHPWIDHIVRDLLDGNPVHVNESDRPLWHAACVMTSNGIAALMAFGESVLARLGIPEPEKVLGPLAAGTVANASEGGGGGTTLTGPVVRGETETLERHIEALRQQAPELVGGYALAVRMILDAARDHSRIDATTADRIEGLLP